MKRIARIAAGLTVGLVISFALYGAVYQQFSPGGALSGTWNSQNVNVGAGAPFITGTLPVARGGTSAVTLTGLLQGNGTSAFTTVTDSSTTGQALRVTGVSTYAFGAIDLANSAAVTGVLGASNGGLGNAFFAVSGPASTVKTFTFPNASASVLTDAAAVTFAQGGTGLASAADDTTLVSSGSAWAAKALPNCGDSTHALAYATSTNSFSCQTVTGSGGSPGGSDTQVQFNSTGAFAGDADFVWDLTNNILTVGSAATPGQLVAPAGAGFAVRSGAGSGGVGGLLQMVAGAGSSNAAGGGINVTSGNGNGTASGGTLAIKAGNGGATSGSGAQVTVTAGNGGSPNGNAAQVSITGGNGAGSGFGGDVALAGGTAGSTGGGGGITLAAAAGGGSGTAGGVITLTSGNGVASNQNAGTVSISTGTRNGSGTANLSLATNGNTRLTIDASGAWNLAGTTPGTSGQVITSNGSSAPTWQAIPSDIRLKTNITGTPLGLDFVKQLRPVQFEWRADTGRGTGPHYGLIAQEVQAAMTRAHRTGVVGTATVYQGGEPVERLDLHYEEITPALIRAVQEQSATIDALAARVRALERAR